MKSKRISFKTDIYLDFCFWAILPAININRHRKRMEFEWLCIGIYISRIQDYE